MPFLGHVRLARLPAGRQVCQFRHPGFDFKSKTKISIPTFIQHRHFLTRFGQILVYKLIRLYTLVLVVVDKW